MTNYGDAYSANSGFFIAPVNGLYSFTAYMQVTYNIFLHIVYLVSYFRRHDFQNKLSD